MKTRRFRTSTPLQLETLEGRMVLSTTAHPIHHVAAAAQVSHHKGPAVPNPVLVNLTPTTIGIAVTDVTYDSRVHLLTVKGAVNVAEALPNATSNYYSSYNNPISYPYSTYISASATQAVDRLRSVSGNSIATPPVANANVQVVPFKISILATNGKFAKGIAQISIYASSPYSLGNNTGYTYASLDLLVRMRNVKAS